MELFKQKSPHICLPITGVTLVEVQAQLASILPKSPDMIELRADFLAEIANTSSVIAIVREISLQTDIPLLFTIRSAREGGQVIPLDEVGVVALLCEVVSQTDVAFIDYEVNNEKENVDKVVSEAHKQGKKVIMSYHNFEVTPNSQKLMKYFRQMESAQADIAKIAVMPQEKADVLRLLMLTREADESLGIPVVTMSMGEIGKISRVLGWVYGSVITFGIGAASSAPGQIEVDDLRTAIRSVQRVSGEW